MAVMILKCWLQMLFFSEMIEDAIFKQSCRLLVWCTTSETKTEFARSGHLVKGVCLKNKYL